MGIYKVFSLTLSLFFSLFYFSFAQGLPDRINNLEDAIEDLQTSEREKVDIVDANGTVLGEVIGFTGAVSGVTFLNLNNKKYVVIVRKIGIIGAFNSVLFANNDFTGQAFLDKGSVDNTMAIPTSVAPLNTVIDPSNETLYEADLNNQVNDTFNSIWSVGDNCTVISHTTDMYLANPVFNLSSLFQPPYMFE